jgi:multiple sugar transport system ATP-binding protein
MAQITLERVSKFYGDMPVVRDIDLTVNDREFVVLIGPSGCGKTTTLRMIAGLEQISSGTVRIGGRVVNDLPPKDRDVAMVFQNYGLYPHMTVYDNMSFGLRMRKVSKPDIHKSVSEAAQFLGIRELLARKPRALSGGQRQRVALGRAIVRNPQLFLFDEPLSNLDAQLRVDMRSEIKKLHQRLQATIVYVTHDQIEAMTMGDRIVIMKDGVIQQMGTPMDVYSRPVNHFVAGFIGSPSMNFAECTVERRSDRLQFVNPGFQLGVSPDQAELLGAHVGRPVAIGIRPEDLQLATGDTPADATINARVDVVEPLGHETLLDMTAGKARFIARFRPDAVLRPGDPIRLAVNVARLHAFDAATGAAIR